MASSSLNDVKVPIKLNGFNRVLTTQAEKSKEDLSKVRILKLDCNKEGLEALLVTKTKWIMSWKCDTFAGNLAVLDYSIIPTVWN